MKKITTILIAAFSKKGLPAQETTADNFHAPATGTIREDLPGNADEDAALATAEASPTREAEWAWC